MIKGQFEKRLWLFYRNIHLAIEYLFMPILQQQELTLPQMRILLVVTELGSVSVGELAEMTQMNTGNCSTLCKKMEARGLIKRTRSTEDERIVILQLRREGAQILEQLLLAVHERQSAVLAALTDEERQQLTVGLDQVERFFQHICEVGGNCPAGPIQKECD